MAHGFPLLVEKVLSYGAKVFAIDDSCYYLIAFELAGVGHGLRDAHQWYTAKFMLLSKPCCHNQAKETINILLPLFVWPFYAGIACFAVVLLTMVGFLNMLSRVCIMLYWGICKGCKVHCFFFHGTFGSCCSFEKGYADVMAKEIGLLVLMPCYCNPRELGMVWVGVGKWNWNGMDRLVLQFSCHVFDFFVIV
ncbi:hypothetical protein U1Q18_040179 [Sarracenia purpurea var. burkii]